MVDVFGFPVSSGSGGDFTPVLKYSATAGRFFRVDRVAGPDGFVSEEIDITPVVKFIADFENVEVGYVLFRAGSQPDIRLVPIGHQLPEKPSPEHNNGIRFMLKLSKECGGEQPVREIMGTSKAWRGAVESVYTQYLAQKGANAGKLPVITCVKITPVKSGASTNFHPVLAITGWAPRGDLVFVPKAVTPSQASQVLASTVNGAAPSTGSTRAAAPSAQTELADDFG